jgi:hypothetical protein
MPLTPEELYLQRGALMAEMPDLAGGPITPEMNKWLGRASAIVENHCDLTTKLGMRSACEWLATSNRPHNAQTIAAIMHRAFYQAELDAPARVQGAFIVAGNTLDAYAAVGRVLGMAKRNVLMVDPYADVKLVTEYAVLASDTVAVRILADAAEHKNTLKPAAQKWVEQFSKTRAPLEVRLAPAKALHDRLIIVDEADAWTLGQSFNKLAERAHTSLVRADAETGARKITAYLAMWQTATPI